MLSVYAECLTTKQQSSNYRQGEKLNLIGCWKHNHSTWSDKTSERVSAPQPLLLKSGDLSKPQIVSDDLSKTIDRSNLNVVSPLFQLIVYPFTGEEPG